MWSASRFLHSRVNYLSFLSFEIVLRNMFWLKHRKLAFFNLTSMTTIDVSKNLITKSRKNKLAWKHVGGSCGATLDTQSTLTFYLVGEKKHFCKHRIGASVARWYIFIPKFPIWVYFGGPWCVKCLYIFSIWCILLSFGTFSCQLEYFCTFWYIVVRQIWQPWLVRKNCHT
jgi:hypothetical protein